MSAPANFFSAFTPPLQRRAVDRPFRLGDRLGPSDMQPQAVEAQAEQAALLGGAIENGARRKTSSGDASNSSRLDDADAGIDEGRDMAVLARRQPALARPW